MTEEGAIVLPQREASIDLQFLFPCSELTPHRVSRRLGTRLPRHSLPLRSQMTLKGGVTKFQREVRKVSNGEQQKSRSPICRRYNQSCPRPFLYRHGKMIALSTCMKSPITIEFSAG